ncbi:hypothetical protein D6F99_25020 [Salmonella enterica]|nr:hypothetical protein [Salmonella enterica]EAM3805028.1 hypothetical protein [Salmonella enterica]EAP2316944.1 hypothetical protein [Salmonella enterica]EAR4201186.1 hypothetical protein [Salmonella enterica]EAS3833611.1 hypothetical protein [Salmonella enterica]
MWMVIIYVDIECGRICVRVTKYHIGNVNKYKMKITEQRSVYVYTQELDEMINEIKQIIRRHVGDPTETEVLLDRVKQSGGKQLIIRISGVSDLRIHFQ